MSCMLKLKFEAKLGFRTKIWMFSQNFLLERLSISITGSYIAEKDRVLVDVIQFYGNIHFIFQEHQYQQGFSF